MPKDIATTPANGKKGFFSPHYYCGHKVSNSPAHKGLMAKAIDYLKEKGFQDNQIHTEFAVHTNYPHGTTGIRVVDVVGIKPQKKIAIECGICSSNQLELIRPYFDEVLHFPFLYGKSTYYYKRPH